MIDWSKPLYFGGERVYLVGVHPFNDGMMVVMDFNRNFMNVAKEGGVVVGSGFTVMNETEEARVWEQAIKETPNINLIKRKEVFLLGYKAGKQSK